MHFIEFLSQATKTSFWDNNRVICFYGVSSSPLFFRAFFDFLREQKIVSIESLRTDDKQKLWAALQQCFLGEQSFYWLGNVIQNFKKKKKNEPDLIDILSLYRGPHAIAFFLSEEFTLSASLKKRMTVIEVKSCFNQAEVLKLFSFFKQKINQGKNALVSDIIKQTGFLSLDVILMLMHYFTVTSSRHQEALQKKVVSIVEPELSLVDLAKAFFTKQDKKFFSLWSERHNDYTIPFWIAYWSEQLWRAYYVVTFLKHNNFAAARRFSYRLPSTFIKQDWRNCDMKELQEAYKALYDIDFAFKKGSTFCSFDLLYCKYFLGKFA